MYIIFINFLIVLLLSNPLGFIDFICCILSPILFILVHSSFSFHILYKGDIKVNINGYKKNNYKLNNNYNYKLNNKNCYKNKFNNCCNNKFNLNSLYEIEKFLCDLRSACKCINLYKFLK